MSSATNNRTGGGFKTLLSPRRRTSFSKKKDEAENPYSALGREKFSALLADVEEKKRMILAEIGADEDDSDTPPPLIRFVNSEKDGKLRPVVIRANGTKYHNKGINREGVSMSMTATMTNPLKTVNLADQEQIKEHQQHQRLPEDEKEVAKEVEKEKEEEEDDDDEGPDFVWFGTENVKQMKSSTPPPPEPKPEENISRPCTKVCDKEEDERRSANKCEVKLLAATHNGLMNSVMKEVESSSSRTGNKLQLEASHVYVGVIVVMMLMLLLLFERYWRIYYLVEFQTKICLHEKMGN